MKKLLIMLATFVAFTSTAAFAEDFDKHGLSITAEGADFGVGISTGASRDFADDARVLGIYTTSMPVTLGFQAIENGSVNDWRLNVSKRAEVPVGAFTAYGVAEAHYDFGDSYTNNELLLSPYAGIALEGVAPAVPFIEAGYDWKSIEGDHLNFNKADSYAKAGVNVPVTPNTTVTVAVLQKMDTDFDKTDREAQLSFNVKF